MPSASPANGPGTSQTGSGIAGRSYDDDEKFYEKTVYDEEYYIEREREFIRQSNLDLELEERHLQKMREDGLLRPALIKSGESNSEAEKESALDQPAAEIPF